MNTKRILNQNDELDNQFHPIYQQSNHLFTYSNDVRNWKSVSHIHSKKKELSLDEIEFYLRKYFSNHTSSIHQHFKTTDFINKQTFEHILRSSNILINNTCFDLLWNSFQPSDKGISYQMFLQRFVPVELKTNQNNILPLNQCQILNYIARISPIVQKQWQNLKEEFSSLDRHGRLFITVDRAINLMRKYCFPLSDKQQCELTLLFSPKNNGQFNYFDFMEYFTNKSTNQNFFSRSTYIIQSKQSWTLLPITIDCILNRIRSQCIWKYESVYRMFKKMDKNQQGYLTKTQFNQLLKQFDIGFNQEELYHVMAEIDKNQDGFISYEELYCALITDALQI